MIHLGLVLGASWGSFGASWAPKLGQVGSQRRLGRGLGSKKRFFKSTTFSKVKPHILASRSRPRQAKIGPRPAKDRPERLSRINFFHATCLWGLFWRPLALKIGAKFDQKIVDNKNRPKMTPRESKSPPGTPLTPTQDPPRAPQDTPRSTPGAPKLAKY